jgi:hypothetical protein
MVNDFICGSAIAIHSIRMTNYLTHHPVLATDHKGNYFCPSGIKGHDKHRPARVPIQVNVRLNAAAAGTL